MEPNLAITGDEARLLMQAMTCESMNYNGQAIPTVASLLLKLQAISVNQPPLEAQKIGESNE